MLFKENEWLNDRFEREWKNWYFIGNGINMQLRDLERNVYLILQPCCH